MQIKVRLCVCALIGAAGLLAVPSAQASITAGNLVVVQVGDGSAALSSVATAGFINEYPAAGGAMVQQIAMPTAGSGSNKRLTFSGTATSEGFLTLSGDGQYLTVGGYDAATGTASITSASAATVNRVIGRIDMGGNVDTSTALADAVNLGNIRSVVSDNGSGFWVGTSAGAARFQTFGTAGVSTQLNTAAPTNVRVMNIFSGQLYMSSASGTFQGVGTLGTGLSNSTGQVPTELAGMPTASGPSPYDFFFANSNTLYVADDRSAASGGGIQKWTQNGGTWSLQYTLAVGTVGARGLAGTVDGSGNVELYATTAEASANRLISIADDGASSVFTLMEVAPANTAFRGVELTVPSPGSLGLLTLAGIVTTRRRRR